VQFVHDNPDVASVVQRFVLGDHQRGGYWIGDLLNSSRIFLARDISWTARTTWLWSKSSLYWLHSKKHGHDSQWEMPTLQLLEECWNKHFWRYAHHINTHPYHIVKVHSYQNDVVQYSIELYPEDWDPFSDRVFVFGDVGQQQQTLWPNDPNVTDIDGWIDESSYTLNWN
jgi:hypothetical protein